MIKKITLQSDFMYGLLIFNWNDLKKFLEESTKILEHSIILGFRILNEANRGNESIEILYID